MNIKILLVEDHDIVREGVRSLLENEPGIEITGEARNGQEALDLCRSLAPDLVLMDVNMPVMSGLECMRIMNAEFPLVRVLILSMHEYESYLIDMLDAGADGYILKNSSKAELLFAIKKVAGGDVYISSEFTLSMLEKYKNGNFIHIKSDKPIVLSEGEAQVLDLIAEGFTNTEIADRLFVSVRTVESRRKKLLEKTNTCNTATLIKFAIRNGLIK